MDFRIANMNDYPKIWEIIQQGIALRKSQGSTQWQNGYPNESTILEDITNNYGYVLVNNNEIVAYVAIIFGIENAYTAIKGKWLTNGEYAVVHRLATDSAFGGKGIATQFFIEIEKLCKNHKVNSIKVDTNYDNFAMLRIFEKLNYVFCGEVFFNGASRKAYEKVISND